LQVDEIDIDNDFFDIGGDSMTAVVLITRLHETFAIDLELSSLFERPTIAGLSEIIDVLTLTSPEFDSKPGSVLREEFDL
jgi:acyl carrier protein